MVIVITLALFFAVAPAPCRQGSIGRAGQAIVVAI
jgi:hypothetical protein